MLSPAVGYAAAAMGYLALHGDGPIAVQELARQIDAPAPYLSKIIHSLVKQGYFDSAKGRGGGVVMRADPRKLTLLELCSALDDDILHPRCAIGTVPCSERRECPAHKVQTKIRAQQLDFLQRTTVQKVGEFNEQKRAPRNGKPARRKPAAPTGR